MTTQDVIRVHLAEQVVAGKRLGRHIHHDPRSRAYPARQASEIVSVKHDSAGLPLNQREHTCSTAHALCGALGASPGLAGGTLLDEASALRIYETATSLEHEPDRSDEHGSSGLMACKAAQQLGLISSYEHAFGIGHALKALVLRPVMTGIKWYTSFDRPDPETGLVELTSDATVRGGHEILADEIDADRRLVWFSNSWGTQFGRHGRFSMTFDTWAQLLQDQGDVTVPVT